MAATPQAIAAVLLPELRVKQKQLGIIYRWTRELELAMQDNDQAATKLALSLRAEAMGVIADSDARLVRALQDQGIKDVGRYLHLCKGKTDPLLQDPTFVEVVQILNFLRLTWEKTVEIDKRLSTKVIGKQSHYEG